MIKDPHERTARGHAYAELLAEDCDAGEECEYMETVAVEVVK